MLRVRGSNRGFEFGIKCEPVLRCLPFVKIIARKHGGRFDLCPFNRARQSRDNIGMTALDEALDEQISGAFAALLAG